jgi:L-aspartate oxidase
MTTDVLILGSGLAGLILALDLARLNYSIVVATKAELLDSNTSYAQGGLAAVTGALAIDSPELHLQDTLKSGAGLTDPAIAKSIINDGARLVRRLEDLGVNFDKDVAGRTELALEGGHSRSRVLHSKDTTGRTISTALVEQVRASSRIHVLEQAIAAELLLSDDRCAGAHLLHNDSAINIRAGAVVLATGGVGQVFERTTNPSVATGDGIALAYRAGARVVDMEFVQFHPTALALDDAPAFLISEAVRGAGAILLDGEGQRFAHRYHPDAELATRDVVARAILSTMRDQNLPSVFLDMSGIDGSIEKRFPNIVRTCRSFGIDPLRQAIPVAPAAHYFMGGVWIDSDGVTSLPGLYAIGECASTGLHGANRLASNSLLEAGVMGMRVAERIAIDEPRIARSPLVQPLSVPYLVPKNMHEFRRCMYRYAGLVRDRDGLEKLMQMPGTPVASLTAEALQQANVFQVGKLIAQAALERKECRGAHWRSDFPFIDNEKYLRRYFQTCQENGWLDLESATLVVSGDRQIPLVLSH